MAKDNLYYYIEETEGKGFNLWLREGRIYYNIAILFYGQGLCEDGWTVNDKSKSARYNDREIDDELENPLRRIKREVAEELISMRENTVNEIYDFYELNIHNQQNA